MSRRRWLAKAVLFCLPWALLLVWTEARMRSVPSSYTLMRRGFEAAAPTVQILVLGASEAHQGVAPARFGVPAYDLADVGQGLREDEALLHWALPLAPRLRWCLLGLSVQSLGYRLQDSPEAWRAFLYEQAYGFPPEAPGQRLDLRRFSRLLFYGFPASFRHLSGLEPLALPAVGPGGAERRDCLDEGLQEVKLGALMAGRRAAEHERLFDPSQVEGNVERLTRMAAELSSRGARLAVFLPPVTAAYAAALNAAALASQRERLKRWARGAGVPVLDHFQDPAFGEADFFDVDHLCGAGADKLTASLADEIKKREGGKP